MREFGWWLNSIYYSSKTIVLIVVLKSLRWGAHAQALTHMPSRRVRTHPRSPLNCRTEGTGETKAEGAAGGGVLAGLGLPALIEKALSLFHKNEGREANAESDTDVKKLSEYIKKYLHFDIAPETIKTQLASLKARFGRGHSATPIVGDTPAPAST